MATWGPPPSSDLTCHECGYDLRAHSDDDVCPECGTSVSQSRAVAAVPRRPAWRDSDPRWRRRMLLGVWLIVLMPTVAVLNTLRLAEQIPIPSLIGTVRSLDDTYFADGGVFAVVMFASGVAMLLSPERGRRQSGLDRAFPWGILGCYLVMLLTFVTLLVVPVLTLAGVSALFMSIPPAFQPEMTGLLATLSSGYLRFAPMPDVWSELLLATISTFVILLASVPIHAALRSTGLRVWAHLILVPVIGLGLIHLVRVAVVAIDGPRATNAFLGINHWYFHPWQLSSGVGAIVRGGYSFASFHQPSTIAYFYPEVVKWGVFLLIAIWLSIAQLRARARQTRSGLNELRGL